MRKVIITMNLIIMFLIIIFLACKYENVESSIELEKCELSRDISESYYIEMVNMYNDYQYIKNINKCHNIIIAMASNFQQDVEIKKMKPVYDDKEFTEDEKYLLAKIAMAEAENQSLRTKILVIMTVLNRVESNDFPDSVLEVIFQNDGKTYQFSPVVPNGRWWNIEPNEDCYKAVEVVLGTKYDYSQGALYFESCKGDSWHNRKLTYLYQSEDLRFYK